MTAEDYELAACLAEVNLLKEALASERTKISVLLRELKELEEQLRAKTTLIDQLRGLSVAEAEHLQGILALIDGA